MPGVFCVVKNCKSSAYTNKKNNAEHIKFFSFPRNKEVCELWLKACEDKNINIKSCRVCSLHFTDEDWRLKDILLNNPITKRLLKPNAVPSLMMPDKFKKPGIIARQKRFAQRDRKKIVESAIADYDNMSILKEKNIPTSNILYNILKKKNIPASNSLIQNDSISDIKSITTQTEVEINCAREFKIMELEKKIKLLERENTVIKRKCEQMENLENSLSRIFTKGQIEKLKDPYKKLNWSSEDISAAISLHSEGPQTYKYLWKQNYPLPSHSTLKTWARKMGIKLRGVSDIRKEEFEDEADDSDVVILEDVDVKDEFIL